MKKLRILLGFSKLMVVEPLTAIALNMRNFIAFVAGIPGICKDFAANRANEHENIHRGGGTLPSGRLRHEKSRTGRLFGLAVVDPHGFAVVSQLLVVNLSVFEMLLLSNPTVTGAPSPGLSLHHNNVSAVSLLISNWTLWIAVRRR